MSRCGWANPNNQIYLDYHDHEWGVPVFDDQHLFEMLCLEGAQAGLSWETVLNKRAEYRRVFYGFDIDQCANLTDNYLESLLQNSGLIRNRLKLFSVRKNAVVVQNIRQEYGSFADYLWGFVNHKPIINNHWDSYKDTPTKTDISDKLAKDLKKRGASFVGSTIMYAFMQAVGMVQDHEKGCFKAISD